jgi:hypothetical protein
MMIVEVQLLGKSVQLALMASHLLVVWPLKIQPMKMKDSFTFLVFRQKIKLNQKMPETRKIQEAFCEGYLIFNLILA